ncbi:MAG: cobalamin biosynthesis protein CbiD [Desulfomonile tiedjei]|uniref:Cobalt-precorrin-5B C(1)-methyltransferase n=1 Tax=Desulfomonile tiedjei TaxID=2358 RepID=A0A9D6Z3E9_9BACT|nr:cobalamin biosynthesis protein CbiD [Desulfomonile tiedjei]
MTSSGRTGFTTGTCAAAAAKAAALLLEGREVPGHVDVSLPDGSQVVLSLLEMTCNGVRARATVKKFSGDDPDVTDGCLVIAEVSWSDSNEVILEAGEGVGTVTKPGLALPVGEPAINPVPRRMIKQAVREATGRGARVVISIPGGKELAEKTFNPRLGVQGGLSILGTSGIVRPFSTSALKDSLKLALSVAEACHVRDPIFVPGRIGEKAARRHFTTIPEQLIEVSNEWGFMLDEASVYDFRRLLVVGHPGKLAKLAQGQWDTHSSRSTSAAPMVSALSTEILGTTPAEAGTVEGIFTSLEPSDRRKLAEECAARIADAVFDRLEERFPVAVVLVDLRGDILGEYGEVSAWECNASE